LYSVTAMPTSATVPYEFVACDHRHRHGLLRPLIPIVDVHVGAADCRLLATLMRTSFGPISGIGTRSIQMPGSALALTKCTHHVGHF
jgi:hypothetical protein